VTFRERRVSDLVRSLADAKAAPGKVIRLASLSDESHLFGMKALEEILLGRDLRPRLAFSLRNIDGAAALSMVNSNAEWSSLSRMNNWVDLRIGGARLLDIRPGQFDRFVFLDERGRPVTPARARTVRLFANFVAPWESIATGPIRMSGPGCRVRPDAPGREDGRRARIADRGAGGISGRKSANEVERGARGGVSPSKANHTVRPSPSTIRGSIRTPASATTAAGDLPRGETRPGRARAPNRLPRRRNRRTGAARNRH
jgi:hypothetical protein